MKVNIGPYPNWIGPYQIVDKIFFWHEKYPQNELAKRWDYVLHDKLSKWLASTWVSDFCEWYHNKFKQRKIEVKIDYYDHWSMDSTLTPIILPLLKQLKEHKQGSGYIDLEDVPIELRYTSTEEYDAQSTLEFYFDPELNKQNIECNVHTRYEWVLDEMIWAFEQLIDDNWEDQYWITKPELDFNDYPEDEGKTSIPVRWKVKGECDWEGRQRHQERIDNGLRLFGKYFQTLWD
jgi:hypothetical protein